MMGFAFGSEMLARVELESMLNLDSGGFKARGKKIVVAKEL